MRCGQYLMIDSILAGCMLSTVDSHLLVLHCRTWREVTSLQICEGGGCAMVAYQCICGWQWRVSAPAPHFAMNLKRKNNYPGCIQSMAAMLKQIMMPSTLRKQKRFLLSDGFVSMHSIMQEHPRLQFIWSRLEGKGQCCRLHAVFGGHVKQIPWHH